MNIVLTGMRGSGKSKISRILKEKLGRELIDIDQEIEKTEDKKIAEIVEKKGWDYFRQKEREVTARVSQKENCIISTGGGTIIDPENYRKLKEKGTIVYLHRLPEDSYKYINEDPNRPSLTGTDDVLEDLQRTYLDRQESYQETADHIIERSDDLEKDAEKIIKLLSST